MKLKVFTCVAALMIAASIPAQAAKIRVVATMPELAEFARAIGGDLIEAESLATGVEDIHAIPMKPSFVPKLSRADIVIAMGLDSEHAFLPALLEASRNPKVQFDRPGYIDCSVHVTPLDVPQNIGRSEGEVHPLGNPHFNLDPVMGRTIVRTICEGLVRNYPEYRAQFEAGRNAYLSKLDAKIAEWNQIAKPLKGVKFISYHNHWSYFSHRYGLTYLGTIELKHGIEPTARHVTEVIQLMKSQNCRIIVREPQFSDRVPNQIAAQTGAKVITLYIMSGSSQVKTYIDLIDYNIKTLAAAAKETGAGS